MKWFVFTLLASLAAGAPFVHQAWMRTGFQLETVGHFAWDTDQGLPYYETPQAHMSYISFQLTENGEIAFLSLAEQKILLFDIKSQKRTGEISLSFSPLDFVLGDQTFFVLDFYQVHVFNMRGNLIQRIPYDRKIRTIERLEYFDGKLWALNTRGKSHLLVENLSPMPYNEMEGWPDAENGFGSCIRISDHLYQVQYWIGSEIQMDQTFQSESKLGTILYHGKSGNYVLYTVERIIQEFPLQVEQQLMALPLDQAVDEPMTLKLPNIHYTYIKHPIQIQSKDIFYMLSAPEHSYLFKISPDPQAQDQFPDALRNRFYHYNDHLTPIEKKK